MPSHTQQIPKGEKDEEGQGHPRMSVCWHKRQKASALSCFLRLPPSINKPLVTGLSTVNHIDKALRDLSNLTKSKCIPSQSGQARNESKRFILTSLETATDWVSWLQCCLLHLTACGVHSSVLYFGWPQVGQCNWESLAHLFSPEHGSQLLTKLPRIEPAWSKTSSKAEAESLKDLFSFANP